jgi:hypothetical protein
MEISNKISFTMVLPGSTMKCTGYRKVKLTLQDVHSKKLPENVGKKIIRLIKVPTYEWVPAKQHINLCKEAYLYMTSAMKPDKYYKKDWPRLNKEQRLEWHLAELAKQYNALEYSYVILDDEECNDWRIPY